MANEPSPALGVQTCFLIWNRDRSEASLRSLLEASGSVARTVCYQVLRSREDAEDVAQTVLVDLLDLLPNLTDERRFRRWLYFAAFHLALNFKRDLNTRRRHETRIFEARMTDPQDVLPNETIDVIYENIHKLDEPARELIIDHYFGRKSLTAIASEQGVSSPAILKRLEKAKESLRRTMTESGLSGALSAVELLLEGVPELPPFGSVLSPTVEAKMSSVLDACEALSLRDDRSKAAAGPGILPVAGAMMAFFVLLSSAAWVLRGSISDSASPQEPSGRVRSALNRTPVTATTAAQISAPVEPERDPQPPGPRPESFEEFDAAFRAAIVIEDSAGRLKALQALGFPGGQADLEALLKKHHLRANGPSILLLRDLVLKEWERRDPGGFADYVRDLKELRPAVPFGDSEENRATLRDVRRKLGASEEEIRAQEEETRERQFWSTHSKWTLLASIVREWVRAEPGKAMAFGESLFEGKRRERFLLGLRVIASPKGIIKTDLPKIPEGTAEHAGLAAAIAAAWAEIDPVAASAWVDEVPGTSNRPASAALAREWAKSDAPSALAWAGRRPIGEDRASLMGIAFDSWTQSTGFDPAAAPALLQLLPPSGVVAGYREVLRTWSEIDPAATALYAQTLSEDVLTGEVSTSLGMSSAGRYLIFQWAYVDPDAAARWIEQSPFSESAKMDLRKELARWRAVKRH